MQFEFTEEQLGIVKAVKEFCAREFKPELALELDKKEEFPLELYRQAAKLGFTSLSFPEEYGGQGYGLLETCLAIEEMCRADSSLGVAVSSGNFGRWINGTKTFITNAPIADFVVVLAQTDTKIRPTYRGETLFVVDKGTQGLETTKLHDKMGVRCSVTGELRFDNVKVMDASIVGELNRGFHSSMEFFDKTRVGEAAQAVGMAQGAFEIAFKYSKQREAFGQPLLQHELIGVGLAEANTKIEAAGWHTRDSEANRVEVSAQEILEK